MSRLNLYNFFLKKGLFLLQLKLEATISDKILWNF